jgi:hypothetical protein
MPINPVSNPYPVYSHINRFGLTQPLSGVHTVTKIAAVYVACARVAIFILIYLRSPDDGRVRRKQILIRYEYMNDENKLCI